MEHTKKRLEMLGLYTFILSSMLGLISVALLPAIPALSDAASWERLQSSNVYQIANYLLIYAYIVAIPGFWAVFNRYAQNRKQDVMGFWGMTLAIFGSAIPLISIGINTFVYPVLMQLGADQAALIGESIFKGSTTVFLLFSGLFYLTGIVLLSVLILKQRKPLCTVAGIALILHGVLIIMPAQVMVNLTSWLLLLCAGILLIINAERSAMN